MRRNRRGKGNEETKERTRELEEKEREIKGEREERDHLCLNDIFTNFLPSPSLVVTGRHRP